MKREIVLLVVLFVSAMGFKTLAVNVHKADTVVYEGQMIIDNDMILVEGSIGSEKGYFIWDNGFSFSAVNKNLQIDKVNVNNTSVTVGDALNHEQDMDFYRIKSMTFGNVKENDLLVIEVDISNVLPCSKVKILGFIGGDIINRYSWNFDFDNHTVKISTEDFNLNCDKAIALDFKTDSLSNMHYMPISLNMFPGWALVDWGMNSYFNVQSTIAWLFPDTQRKYTIQGNSMSAISGKNSIAEQWVVDTSYSLKIGEYEVVDKYLSDANISEQLFSEAVLGNLFFRESFNVIINKDSAKYILLERKLKDENFVPQSISYGVTLNKNDDTSLSIDGIIKEHPDVLRSGLKPLDSIISVNGHKAVYFKTQCELDGYVRLMKRKKEKLTLELSEGKKITLHLVDIWSVIK